MLKRLIGIIYDEEGATMVEYALMLALIAVICIIAVTGVGTKVMNAFTKVEVKPVIP